MPPNYKDVGMKLTELSLLALLTASLLSGCGSESDSDPESEPPVAVPAEGSGGSAGVGAGAGPATPIPDASIPVPPPIIYDPISTLKGSWLQECMVSDDGEGSFSGTAVYDDENLKHFVNFYTGNSCQNISARIEMSGSYVLGDQALLNSGRVATYLAQEIMSFKVAYYDATVISKFNDNSACNRVTWAVGELQEIRGCSEFDFESFKKDIVNITDNQMVSGDFDFTGEDGYPTQLESDVLLKQDATVLEGKWLQECAVLGQQSRRNEVEFIGNAIQFKGTAYSDSGCEVAIFSQKGAYLFELGEERILASGERVKEMTNSPISLNLAFHGIAVVEQVNQAGELECGTSDWLDSEFKDVFDCAWFTGSGDREFSQIVKIESDHLTYGDETQVGDDGYATQLQANFYIKQN